MTEALSALIKALAFLFGLYEEAQLTREQCEQMWSSGYVAYPLSDEQFQRIEQCHELQRDEN